MADELIQFNFCVRGDKGMVHLADAGLDVFRAFIMKLMEQAQRGEDAARALGNVPGNDYSKNQAAYFKAAKTFLAGVLVGQLTPKMNLRSQLAEAHSWREMNSIPDRWSAAVADALQEATPDGTDNPSTSRGGSGGNGGDRVDSVATRQPVQGREASDPAAGTADNRTAGEKPAGRKGTQRKGKG